MLYEKLKKNKKIPFHMPGHKRNAKLLGDKLPYKLDITEIDSFDNLHNPEGIIKEIENKAKNIYNSGKSFILVNGSTVGILAGVSSTLKRGDTVLVARNCHKSVYNALELMGADIHFIYSGTDEYGIFRPINTDVVKLKIDELKPKLIIITSPTYEGVCSDVENICKLAHSFNIPVLLDAAHGAHMYELGSAADIVIMSLHKTLPALTQCAVAHINGDLVSSEKFRIKLSVFETSSPSYVLMASIDECLTYISSKDYKNITGEYLLKRFKLNESLSKLNHLKALEYDDINKLIIFTGYSDINGIRLADILRSDYNIEVEMAGKDYIILITTECDDFKNYTMLSKALKEIDNSLVETEFKTSNLLPPPKKNCNPFELSNAKAVSVDLSAGKVCGEYVWAYPPGVPLIVPGEVISEQLIESIKSDISDGVNIQSTYMELPEKIYCQL